MNKSELINKIAVMYDMPAKKIDDIINAAIYITRNELIKGNKVQILGFGTFQVRARKSRKGRNPRTDEEILIPAHKLPAFTAGGSLKRAVNKCKTNSRR